MRKDAFSVGIIGGGLAGLSAAVALAGRGLRVELFESRPRLGGRAGAFWEPAVGAWIDFGQHVLMGCCTQMLQLCRRTGLDQFLCWYRRLYFSEPHGQTHRFEAAGSVLPPFHLLPAFCRLGFLSFRDRLRVIQGVVRLIQANQPREQTMTFGQWLLAQGQPISAIQRFWTPVVLSALAELPDRVALSAARKVFLEGFLATSQGYQLLRPILPWGQLLNQHLGQWLAHQGVVVHPRMPVRLLEGNRRQVQHLILKDGTRKTFDFYILAVPWRQAASLLAPAIRQAIPQLAHATQLHPGAITTWHLWLDRPITCLPHTMVVGRRIQWVFAGFSDSGKQLPNEQSLSVGEIKSTHSSADAGLRLLAGTTYHHPGTQRAPKSISGDSFPAPSQKERENWCYYQVVLSATHALPATSIPQTIEEVLGELREIFPVAQQAQLRAFRRVKMPEAVFSPQPGVDRIRPDQKTPIPNLALAGDWTDTGWPATMESAVRSGQQAAKVVFQQQQIRS